MKDKDLLEKTKRDALNIVKLITSLLVAINQNKFSAFRIPHSAFSGGGSSG